MLFEDIKIVDREFQIREHMFVGTEGPYIRYVGDRAPLKEYGSRYDGRRKLLMPGFYNTHCHVPMTLLRGLGEGLPLHRWLNEKVFPFEAKMSRDDVYKGTLLGAMELMASGCVSISDTYFLIQQIAEALYESGMKANVSHSFGGTEPDADIRATSRYTDTVETAGLIRHMEGRILLDVGLHAEYTSNERVARQVAELAKEYDAIVQAHASETEKEHQECKERHGGRTPLRYFHDCGLMDTRLIAAHCIYAEEEDLDLMREKGAVMAHNPSSNLKLGSGIVRIRDFMDRGVSVTIGTDGPSSNNNLNFMEELHLAALLSKGSTKDCNSVSDAELLRMATRGGALAQGREDCGLLDEDFRADLIVIDLDRPHMQPDYDTLSNLLYSAQASDVCMTMIDGKVVYMDGEFTTLDREKIIAEASEAQQRIMKSL